MDAKRLLRKKLDIYVPANANEGHIVDAIVHYLKTKEVKFHGKMREADALVLKKAFFEHEIKIKTNRFSI